MQTVEKLFISVEQVNSKTNDKILVTTQQLMFM